MVGRKVLTAWAALIGRVSGLRGDPTLLIFSYTKMCWGRLTFDLLKKDADSARFRLVRAPVAVDVSPTLEFSEFSLDDFGSSGVLELI